MNIIDGNSAALNAHLRQQKQLDPDVSWREHVATQHRDKLDIATRDVRGWRKLAVEHLIDTDDALDTLIDALWLARRQRTSVDRDALASLLTGVADALIEADVDAEVAARGEPPLDWEG